MLEEKIKEIIEKDLKTAGYEVYRIKFNQGKDAASLQVMIERTDESGVIIDDCEAASKIISMLLDVEDPISSAYNLEVSSPGIDRPLIKLDHYKKYIGHKIKIGTILPVGHARTFTGDILEVTDTEIKLSLAKSKNQDEHIVLDFSNIQNGKLLLTDKLIDFSEKMGSN